MHPVDPRTDGPLTSRPLSPDDLEAVYALVSAAELEDAGEVLVERADIEADWSRPSSDLARDTVGVLDGARLVGLAEVSRRGARAEVTVHPGARGRGVGTWLAAWSERRSATWGASRVGQSVPEGSAPHRFLEARGYDLSWTSWVLRLPPGAAVPERRPPPGYRIVTARGHRMHRAAHRVVTDAFGEWSDRSGQTFEEWAPGVVHRTDFEPWMLRTVEHESEGVVGACYTRLDAAGSGFVGQLAVDRAHRGRGLARALLADGFGNARAHGATTSELTTDSRTGAIDLYLDVGMEITSTWLNLGTDPRVSR